MKRINKREYVLNTNDFVELGLEVERVLTVIKSKEYGHYSAEELGIKEKLALRIISGMHDWQWQHNKGIRIQRDFHITVEIYELHALQKQIDEILMTSLV